MRKQVVTTIALLATALAATAQSSGNLTVQGAMPSVISIAVAPISGYDTLDLINGVNNQPIANLTERSNRKAGYTVTLTSLNAGLTGNSLFLADTAGGPGTDLIAYSLTYNGVIVNFANGSALLTDSNGRTSGSGIVKSLTVTISPSWLSDGTYADTLTFTIAAK